MKKFYVIFFVVLFFVFGFFVFDVGDVAAQNPDRGKPLEVIADDTLEWHRNDLFFRAKKNVKVVQGDTVLYSDVLTAKYKDGDKSSMQIYHIQADGNVRIVSSQSKAYGDKATYNVDKGYAVMTGRDLRMVSDGQSLRARDKFEYWVNAGKLIATGNAVAVREGDQISANQMTALFTEDSNGKRVLKSLEAVGDVVITTPDEVLKGARATYDATETKAVLYDNVVIKRGPNILQGTRAELNTETNVSKIFGGIMQDGADGGRVRGVFYPKTRDD